MVLHVESSNVLASEERVLGSPKSHAYLLFGFTLARANARMLINAEAKRRSARNSARASRPQCTSAVAVHR